MGILWEARRPYAEHYPQLRIPPQKLFTEFHLRLKESGSFAYSFNAYRNVILAHISAGIGFRTC
jgi:hypothetical protein